MARRKKLQRTMVWPGAMHQTALNHLGLIQFFWAQAFRARGGPVSLFYGPWEAYQTFLVPLPPEQASWVQKRCQTGNHVGCRSAELAGMRECASRSGAKAAKSLRHRRPHPSPHPHCPRQPNHLRSLRPQRPRYSSSSKLARRPSPPPMRPHCYLRFGQREHASALMHRLWPGLWRARTGSTRLWH